MRSLLITGESEETKGQEAVATRGEGKDALAKVAQYSNFCMLFGTKPAKFVLLETKMVENLLDHLTLKRDKLRKTVKFPKVLD